MAYLRSRSSKKIDNKAYTWLWEVEYSEDQYTRRSLSIGRLRKQQASEIFKHFEELERAKRVNQQPAIDTLEWLAGIDEKLFARLSAIGFITCPIRRNIKGNEYLLGAFTQRYLDQMEGSAARTKDNYNQTRRWLIKHFGEDKPLASITPEDMKRWQRSLKGLALSNRNKHIQRAKTFFRSAVNDLILRESPAAILKEESLPGGRKIDCSRQFNVNADLTQKVMAGLPTNRWRLIFALLRFQGLRRCEVFAIRWSNIDWKAGRMQIESQKTGLRDCPIFPEVVSLLEEEFALAVERADAKGKSLDKEAPVIVWHGTEDSLTGLMRTRVARIVGEANVWPKVLQQLRSTRRTELEERFPAHVCDEWLGHDVKTANEHYNQVTAEHWERAAGSDGVFGPKISRFLPALNENLPFFTRSQEPSTEVSESQKTKKPLETVAFPGVRRVANTP